MDGMLPPALLVKIRMDQHCFGSPWSGSISGMWIRIQEQRIWTNLTNNPDFQLFKTYVWSHVGMFFLSITYFKNIIHVKFNFLWQQGLTRIQIRICIGLSLDPDLHRDENSNADPQHWLKEYTVPRDESNSSCKKPGTISFYTGWFIWK